MDVQVNKVDPLEILAKVYNGCNEVFSNKIHDAYLYGSYARGDYSDDSDIDILLTVDTDDVGDYHGRIAHMVSDLSLEYGITVSVTVKPLWRFLKFADILPYYGNVLKEGIRYAG